MMDLMISAAMASLIVCCSCITAYNATGSACEICSVAYMCKSLTGDHCHQCAASFAGLQKCTFRNSSIGTPVQGAPRMLCGSIQPRWPP